MLSDLQAGVAVLLEEPKEVLPVHKVQQAWLHRLHRQLIRLACNNCVQAEDFTRLRDPHDKSFPSRRSDGELGLSLAKHEDSTWGLPFNKNDRAVRENRATFYLVESFQRFLGEGTEETVGTQVASKTFSGQTVRRVHGRSSSAREAMQAWSCLATTSGNTNVRDPTPQ